MLSQTNPNYSEKMELKGQFKYLVSGEKDAQWGVTVDDVGETRIPAGYETYPPSIGHPEAYFFDTGRGRILDNYHLVYITKGKGLYFSAPGVSVPIRQGDMFLIRPGVWHSYLPDKATGWQEYWIGMRGPNIDNRFDNLFFDPEKTVYHVGIREELVDLYHRAIEAAQKEEAACQQLLAGIANLILGMTLYYDSNRHFSDQVATGLIDRARTLMRERLFEGVTPEEIAGEIHMSYSWFRKKFREYTGLSPARYIQELKLRKARSLLLHSDNSVKEIVFLLNYTDASHFSILFKKYTGFSPSEYREKFRT